MSPVTHFLHGWALAQFLSERRDRIIVTLAAVAPDMDGLGIIPEVLTRNSADPLPWFTQYHHLLAHNLLAAICITGIAFALGKQRLKVTLLAFMSFHLHLFGDLIGSRGPDGMWSIPYLYPFSNREWSWAHQWPLASWQNLSITIALLGFAMYWTRTKGISPVEIFSKSGDRKVVAALNS